MLSLRIATHRLMLHHPTNRPVRVAPVATLVSRPVRPVRFQPVIEKYLVQPLRFEDQKVFNLVEKEKGNQTRLLNLAPSANYCSKSVLTAMGSVVQNPNSEGYLGRRYFPGTQELDKIERLCQERALSAFALDDRVWGVNVQTHSRELACLQACSAILRSDERLLLVGSLPGSMINKYFSTVSYRQAHSSSEIDCRAVEEMVATYAPRMIFVVKQIRSTDYEALGRACRASNLYLVADITADSGMISAGIAESPFKHADIIVSGTRGGLRGPSGALIFCRQNTEVLSPNSKDREETRSLGSAIDASVFPGHQGGPHNHAIAAVAVAMGQVLTPAFKAYQTLVLANAAALKVELVLLGYCLRGSDLPSQLVEIEMEPRISRVLTHVLQAASIAHKVDPSGKRLQIGTQAMTSRGLLPDDFRKIAGFLHGAVSIAEAVSKFKATGLEGRPDSRPELSTPLSDIRNDGWIAKAANIQDLKQEVEIWTSQYMLP